MINTWEKGAYNYLELKENIGSFLFFRYNRYGQELEIELEAIADNVYRYKISDEFYKDYFVVKNDAGVYFKYSRNDFKKPPPNDKDENDNDTTYDTSDYEIIEFNVEPFTVEEQPFNRQGNANNIANRQIVFHNIMSWFGYDSGAVTTDNDKLHMGNHEVISKEEFDGLTPQDIRSGNFIVYKDENEEVFATVGYTNGNTIVYTPAVNLLDAISTRGSAISNSTTTYANYNQNFIIRDAYNKPFYVNFGVYEKEWLGRPYLMQARDVYLNERYKGQNGTFTISGTNIQVDIENNSSTYNSLDWESAQFLGAPFSGSSDFLIQENYSRGLMLPSNPLRTTEALYWEGTYILGSNELDRSFGIISS